MRVHLPAWFIVFLFTLSGCLSLPHGRHEKTAFPHDSWGLGLQIPVKRPQPGPYLESEAQVRDLETFLRQAGATMGTRCHPDTLSAMNRKFEQGYVFPALGVLLTACSQENATITRETALASLNETKRALDEAMPPATLVETEFLARLMSEYQTFISLVDSKQYSWAQGESDTIRALVRSYPWKNGECRLPNLDAYAEGIRAEYARALAIPVQDGLKGTYADEQKGVLRDFQKNLDSEVEDGWWPILPGERQSIEWRSAIIANATRTVWPTLEETHFILDRYRNSTRSLPTDSGIDGMGRVFDSWWDHWESNPWPAMRIYAFQAVKWEFGAVECPSVPG